MNDVEFYLNNEDVNGWFDKVGLSNSKAIKRKIRSKNSKHYLNLRAVIDELRVGAFISEIESVEYDFNINGKTPDWYAKETNSIIEVRGTNQIEKDLIREQFEDCLKNNIQRIKGKFFVSVNFDGDANVEYFKSFNHEDFIKDFSDWFLNNDKAECFFECNGVKITILEEDTGLECLEVGLGNLNFINIDTRKLKNIIDEKLKNYKELIRTEKSEFIIAIVSDVKNGLREIDLQKLLYGPSIFNQISDTNYSSLNGLYYNQDYGDYISGVIFLIRGQKPCFFKNHSHTKHELSNKIEKYVAQHALI